MVREGFEGSWKGWETVNRDSVRVREANDIWPLINAHRHHHQISPNLVQK